MLVPAYEARQLQIAAVTYTLLVCLLPALGF